MSRAKICDVCGEVINPEKSGSGVIVYTGEYRTGRAVEYDLCVSCAFKLNKFLEGKSEGNRRSNPV